MSPALAWTFLTTRATWEALIHNLASKPDSVAQVVKNPPAIGGDLGWEDPLEEGMATHSSVLAWKIRMDREEPGGLQTMGSRRGQDRATKPS